ncbi:hypothetical protein [Streptomyces decoyicus]|uniref:hypothetical protein n=1 Tax=Streptomyces decoyicus TaxID=249567 RepID=UPI0012371A5E|nr:hypothetical protein [Streptomyces decoyicus]QZY20236.1 hypothetical protein K7C20_37775 [Streptomyces decoyicus]
MNARGQILGKREEVCWISGLSYQTFRVVNGRRQVTGSADMNVINYSYGDSGMPRWGYGIEVSAYRGWGDALKASISGKATKDGACKVHKSSFPSRKLAPLSSWKLGESFFDTTATRSGAIGRCATTWTLSVANGTYGTSKSSFKLNEFRCDNATAGRATVGCVVPWYASPLIYSKSRAPQLASHITRAQRSGLPGATFKSPLTRTTNAATMKRNRDLACPRDESRPHPALNPQGPGWYRMRVHASGRSINPDGVSEEPVEDYLIAVWPQEPAESVVIRSSKMIDEALPANADTTPDDTSHATPEPDDAAEADRRADVRARLLRSLQDD